jgi:hypothetical protein
VHLSTALPADPASQQSTPQSFDVDDHESIGLLHFRHGMRLQSQLLSEKCFYEHLNPLPFDGRSTTALKGLDGSGIQAAHSAANLLHLKPFNFNCTFGTGTLVRLVLLLSEPRSIFYEWQRLVSTYRVSGKNTHNARLAAAMKAHRISRILTFNVQDFARYKGIETLHPAAVAP